MKPEALIGETPRLTWRPAARGNPLFGIERDVHQRFDLAEAEGAGVTPGLGAILERAGKGCGKERICAPVIESDGGLHAAVAQSVKGFV